ncbi:MAG: protein kinase [Myxococcota bacterium]
MSDTKFGKYTLQKRIAFGGMAEIYLARLEGQDGFRKTCVLKRILPQFGADDAFVRMFIDEAVLAARLNHPNVVQTYDFGDVDGTYYIAMEHIDGPDLRKLIVNAVKRGRSLSVAEACALVEEMCRGLSYVHNLRDETGEPLSIVHRDISPHNVMVARAGQAKIMDFGIAKAALRASQTRTGTVKGKLAYMAPEQASAQPMDKRTDQFAVGLVLWECLTGARHFEGTSEPELFGKVLRGDIRDVREVRPDVPEELAHITNRMLQIAPGDRYSDLSDAEHALSAFRFSLGAEGAVRIQDTVAELAPPVDLKASSAPVSEPSSAPPVASAPNPNAPGHTVELKSDAVESAGGGWELTAGAEEVTRSALASETALAELGSSPSIQVSADSTMPPTHRSAALRYGAVGVVVAASVALVFAFAGRGGGGAVERPVAEAPMSVSAPDPVPRQRTLRLESVPSGASILIDGKDTGLQTPTTLPNLDDGKVLDVELRRDGYAPWSDEIVVTPGKERVEAKLVERVEPPATAALGELRIDSEPSGATVLIDEVRSDKRTPMTVSGFEMGKAVKLELRLKGHRSVTADVAIDRAVVSIRKKLSALPRPAEPAPPSRKAPGTGKLSLRVVGPWAEVFLGRKSLGVTPIDNVEVPAGRITLQLKNPAAGVDKKVSLDVKRGKLLRRTVHTK